jgi:hypothetical protein
MLARAVEFSSNWFNVVSAMLRQISIVNIVLRQKFVID